MALTDVDITAVSFDGSDVILEHGDDIPISIWNTFVENGAASYYLPAVAVALNSEISFNYDDQKELWGAIPPSNPAAGSANEEYFICVYEYSWEWDSGAGEGYVGLYMGTDMGSMTGLDLHVLGSGTSGTRSGTLLSGTSTFYNSTLGTAPVYMIKLELFSQNTAPRSNYKITGLNIYYQKYIP